MRNLFDPSVLRWPQLRDSLHVYVLPGSEFVNIVQPAVDAVAGFDFCVPVAPQWMHATVTRIPWWRTEVDDRTLTEFGHALDVIAAGTAAFSMQMTGPFPDETGVAMEASSSALWRRLLDGTRAAAEQIFGTSRPLPAPPTRPHVSLGYGVADADSEHLLGALKPIEVSAELAVKELCFVAVHQDPSAGTFTWDVISSHRLAAGARDRTVDL
ncbi:hypothetical protein ABZ412_34700 [Nocardia sp. NPDC005746]|uniref:hypothetical protein n=1 Tax=Nocardia sp. NPDC005746 TaxID=3157062 RepID=UPI0033F47D80